MKNHLRLICTATLSLMLSGNAAYAYNDNAQIFLSNGERKLKSGHHKEAIADFTSAIGLEAKLAPSELATAYFNRGVAKRLTGDMQGSKADFLKNMELQYPPKDASAYYYRGAVKSAAGDREGAISDMKKAAVLGNTTARNWLKNNGITYFSRANNGETKSYLSNGKAKLKSGNNKDAIAEFTRAIEFDQNLSSADITSAYFNRGIAKRIDGDSKGAKADFLKAIQYDPIPKDAEAFCNRATAKSAIKDNEGAIEDFKKAAMFGDITARKWLTNNRYKW